MVLKLADFLGDFKVRRGCRNRPCFRRMLLFHPIPRDYGFYPPLGSFDAALGPTALGQHQNSLGAGNTHDPTGWPCNNVSFRWQFDRILLAQKTRVQFGAEFGGNFEFGSV